MIKKNIIYILIVLLLFPALSSALDICGDTPQVNTDCAMVTPAITCSSYTYTIFNTTNNVIEQGTLTQLRGQVYYFNFNQPAGDYLISLCDGGLREITVSNLNEQYYLYVVAAMSIIALLILGYKIEDTTFIIISGMLMGVMALNIYLNGFPNLANDFIKNGIVIVLTGISFYLIIAPSIEWLEKWFP